MQRYIERASDLVEVVEMSILDHALIKCVEVSSSMGSDLAVVC